MLVSQPVNVAIILNAVSLLVIIESNSVRRILIGKINQATIKIISIFKNKILRIMIFLLALSNLEIAFHIITNITS
jgi:hypothetical protein